MSWLHTWNGMDGWTPTWDLLVLLAAAGLWLSVAAYNRRGDR